MVLFLLLVLICVLIYLFTLLKEKNTLKKRFEPYQKIEDTEKEYEEINAKKRVLLEEIKALEAEREHLKKLVAIFKEDEEAIEFGYYEPEYNFENSELYKSKISEIREKQKSMIRNKTAVVCHSEWTLGGSKAEGKKMANENLKLMLRAFNGECDAATSQVNYKNITKMIERINKNFEIINKLATRINSDITVDYLNLKIEELKLVHEYHEKKEEEREEQREIREMMKEEARRKQEIEKALKEAQMEEQQYIRALEQARKEMEIASDEEISSIQQKMTELEEKLKEAEEKNQRAISQAELTKSGHVYIISNIGSFGKDVYKIGMTRRLDPLDRVKELGDASVPFPFDVHAMIYSDNAPELENKLHKAFDRMRVNRINIRKEFFRVTLNEIEQIANHNGSKIEFTKIAEAKEYNETISLLKKEGHLQTN
ncbi:MAG: DUF4041 domain-containing protein [Candidatus Kapaibacterium sp.]